MSEVAIGEFEIITDFAPAPAPEAGRDDAQPPGHARLRLGDLAAMQQQLQDSALRVWAD